MRAGERYWMWVWMRVWVWVWVWAHCGVEVCVVLGISRWIGRLVRFCGRALACVPAIEIPPAR